MGVHNLWELLSPVGRRVSVETLAGKKLAIDASIWIVQFMKAMRDEKGEMVRNAHLIGFFRRICKLLFLRTKPVFVFDGGTPALKRRTVIARRRQRENAQSKIRKNAEKLLMNQLKTMKLKQLAEEIKNQRIEGDTKGKKVLSDQNEVLRNISEKNDAASGSYNQEKLDEMLAASLAAEEDMRFTGNASTSAAGIPLEEEDDGDDDEEMILPTMHGKVDPAVLAALPPSMQLDLLVQMRERLMAENRQKYQKVKKAPSKFSELQIQSYLKTVAFRREIDAVRKSAAGRGVDGVQTLRIASESNREFIFSSSFTGDKQVLTSAGAERSGNKQHQTRSECPSGLLDSIASSVNTSTATGSVKDEPGKVLENNVETYVDDRGHLRVSRVRAMGIRMTRDLQRNLDMMKEMEQERSNAISEASIRNDVGVPRSFPSKDQFPGTSNDANDETDNINYRNQQSISKNDASIEISFEEDGEHKWSDGDDDLFARLVAGNPVIISSVDNSSFRKQSPGFDSESDWEDGLVEDKVSSLKNDAKAEIKPSFVEDNTSNESEVECEEGVCVVPKSDFLRAAEYAEAISRGCQEEETDMHEAIRRSLEDLKGKKCVNASSENENKKKCGEMAHEYPRPKLQSDSSLQQNEPICETLTGVDKQDGEIGTSIPMVMNNVSGTQLASSITSKYDNMASLVGKSCERYVGSPVVNLQEETQEFILSTEKHVDASSEVGEVPNIANSYQVNGSYVSDSVFNNVPDANLVDACKYGSEAGQEAADLVVPVGEYSAKQAPINLDVEQKLVEERDHINFSVQREHSRAEVTEATLKEEMLVLGQEFINLGDEQRKNERNAESVSSEMFAECQELLQMFGLPYIISPMEAEAQCAYLELANLVDGVVTDDSDVFLFGARSVYKNIFDDRKYVETYFMKDIENELGLSRDKLIRIALLLGSDYTEGISGIGIVNAIEVINAFPEEDGLHKFREWIESPDPNILGKFHVKTGSSSRKQGSAGDENDVSHSDGKAEGVSASEHIRVHENEQSVDYIEEIKQIFMDKHRNVSKNWHIPSSFPSEAVISAYASPEVDKSTEPFAWGKPDLFVLRKLCWEKFGWISQKADDLLLPVLKEYNKHETQLRLEAFYTFNERFAKVRSKRIKEAVKGITGNESSELQDGSVQAVSKTRKRRRVGPIESVVSRSEKLLHGTDNDDARKESSSKKTLSHMQSGEGEITASAELTPSMEGKAQPLKWAVARGRIRGRGRRQQVGRGGRKGSLVIDSAKSSSSDGNSSNNEQEVHVEKLEELREVRRSTRSRKPVYYPGNDLEYDDDDKALDQEDGECADKLTVDQELSRFQGLCRDAPVGPIDTNQHNEVGLREDHCDIGSTFCMDEDEIGEVSVSHNGDPSFEAEFSRDYLKMGGGFCMDEDETEKDPYEQANDPAAATTAENTDVYHSSASMDKIEHENHLIDSVYSPEEALNRLQDGGITEASTVQNLNFPKAITNDVSNLVGPTQENTDNNTCTTSVKALSAMPFLRRKRRKG